MTWEELIVISICDCIPNSKLKSIVHHLLLYRVYHRSSR